MTDPVSWTHTAAGLPPNWSLLSSLLPGMSPNLSKQRLSNIAASSGGPGCYNHFQHQSLTGKSADVGVRERNRLGEEHNDTKIQEVVLAQCIARADAFDSSSIHFSNRPISGPGSRSGPGK